MINICSVGSKYQVRVARDYLGTFDTEEEAVFARDAFRLQRGMKPVIDSGIREDDMPKVGRYIRIVGKRFRLVIRRKDYYGVFDTFQEAEAARDAILSDGD